METKTKRNLVIWGVIILVLLNITSLATIWYHRYQYRTDWSQKNYAEKSRMQQHQPTAKERLDRTNFITRDLDLSAVEKIKFDSIWKHYGDKKSALEGSLEENRMLLAKIMASNELDTTQFYAISANQAKLMESLNRVMLEMNLALRNNLTDEQMHAFLLKMQRMENRRMSARKSDPMSRVKAK